MAGKVRDTLLQHRKIRGELNNPYFLNGFLIKAFSIDWKILTVFLGSITLHDSIVELYLMNSRLYECLIGSLLNFVQFISKAICDALLNSLRNNYF